MKLHLLLLFLLAAPVVSRVLSFEFSAPSEHSAAAASTAVQPVPAATATPPPSPRSAAPAPRALPRIPACHAFTFM